MACVHVFFCTKSFINEHTAERAIAAGGGDGD